MANAYFCSLHAHLVSLQSFIPYFFEILQCIPPTGANQTGARFFLLENVQNYTTLLSVIMQACIFLYHFEKIY